MAAEHRSAARRTSRPAPPGATWHAPVASQRWFGLATRDGDGVRPLLRDSRPAAVDARAPSATPARRRRSGGARRAGGVHALLDRRAPLPRRVLALLGAGGAVRRDRRAHHDASRSATACGCCRCPTTIRCASPRWPRRSTSSATGGSSSAPAARRRAPSSRASASIPHDTREHVGGGARASSIGAWTERRLRVARASYFQVPPRRVHPKPLQKPHPPLWVASTSPDSHEHRRPQRARPALLHHRRAAGGAGGAHPALPRRARGGEADRQVRQRRAPPPSPWCTARRPTKRRGANAAESVVWYLQQSIAADRHAGRPGSGAAARPRHLRVRASAEAISNLSGLSFDMLDEMGAVIVGDPDALHRARAPLPRRRAAISCSA